MAKCHLVEFICYFLFPVLLSFSPVQSVLTLLMLYWLLSLHQEEGFACITLLNYTTMCVFFFLVNLKTPAYRARNKHASCPQKKKKNTHTHNYRPVWKDCHELTLPAHGFFVWFFMLFPNICEEIFFFFCKGVRRTRTAGVKLSRFK